MSSSKKSQFSDVDSADNPQFFVDYLATKWKTAFSQAYKARIRELMNLHPAASVLDVGCGMGIDLDTIIEQSDQQAAIVGLDYSHKMLREALNRTTDTAKAASFINGDCHQLPFASNSFDVCYADKVFQHLNNPQQSLHQMIRVTKPGGKVIIVDPDHDIRVVDTPYRDITQRVFRNRAGTLLNGGIAHEQYRHFQIAGLVNVYTEPAIWMCTDYEAMDSVLKFDWTIIAAIENNVITVKEGEQWLTYVKEAGKRGHFFAIIMYLITVGTKPS